MNHPAALPASSDISADAALCEVSLTAAAWNCRCVTDCSALEAAHCLYRTTLDLLSGREDLAAAEFELLRPLAVVVRNQKSRRGQADCSRFAKALKRGDHAAALAACRRLIERERTPDQRTPHSRLQL